MTGSLTGATESEAPVELASPDIERELVAQVMLRPDMLDRASFLKPEDFHYPDMRIIWQALVDARANGVVLHPRAFASELRDHLGGEAEARALVAGLLDEYGLPMSADRFHDLAANAERWSKRRQVAYIAEAISGDAYTMPVSDTVELMVSRAVSALMGVETEDTRASHRIGKFAAQVYDKAFDRDVSAKGAIYSGIDALDDRLGGFRPGELIIIAGRPGMGKTVVGSHWIRKTCEASEGALFFQLEMGAVAITARMMCDVIRIMGASVFYRSIRDGKVPDRFRDVMARAVVEMDAWPVEVDARGGLSIDQIFAKARMTRKAMAREGRRLGVIVVDHLGLVESSAVYKGNRTAEVTEVTKALKKLAKEMDCPVVALCQLNRGVDGRENKRPILTDLRESGSIEQDADIVMLCYREAYYVIEGGEAKYGADYQAKLNACRYRLEINTAKMRDGEPGVDLLDCDVGTNSLRAEGALS